MRVLQPILHLVLVNAVACEVAFDAAGVWITDQTQRLGQHFSESKDTISKASRQLRHAAADRLEGAKESVPGREEISDSGLWKRLKEIVPGLEESASGILDGLFDKKEEADECLSKIVEFLRADDPSNAQVTKDWKEKLKGLEMVKNMAELVLHAQEEEFQRKLLADIQGEIREVFELFEHVFYEMMIPTSGGYSKMRDRLATKTGKHMGIHARLREYWNPFDGDLFEKKRFTKGFFEEFSFHLHVTHPRTIDKDGSGEFQIHLALEDVTGVYAAVDSNLTGLTNWQTHRLVFNTIVDGKTGEFRIKNVVWMVLNGPAVHFETSFEEKYTQRINMFRMMIQPTRLLFEKLKTGEWGISDSKSLLDMIRPDEDAALEDISKIRPEPANNITTRGIYWNFVASSWATGFNELTSGWGGSFYHEFDLSKMTKENPKLIVGIFAMEMAFSVLGAAAASASISPWIGALSKGRGTLTSTHLAMQIGAGLADVLLAYHPAYKEYSFHSADIWGFLYGYPFRYKSKTNYGHRAIERARNSLTGSTLAKPYKKWEKSKVPFKSTIQINMYFIFSSKNDLFLPEKGEKTVWP